MKKDIFLSLALLLGSWSFISCGDEEDDIVVQSLPDSPNISFNPIIMPENGYVILYHVYNQNGERTKEFKLGDDIIFDLQLYNFTDSCITILPERYNPQFLSLFNTPWIKRGIEDGIFNIHDVNNKFIGYPYNPSLDGIDLTASLMLGYKLKPKECLRWNASWSGTKYENFMNSYISPYWSYGANNKPLESGQYHSEFDVRLTT